MWKFAFLLFLPFGAQAASDLCRHTPDAALQQLASGEPEQRSAQGLCLIKYHLGRNDVAHALLKIIRNPNEDLFLREDLITAFGQANLRRRLKVEEKLAPKMDQEAVAAVERTVSGVGSLLDLTQAVNSMDEVLPVTTQEGELFASSARLR